MNKKINESSFLSKEDCSEMQDCAKNDANNVKLARSQKIVKFTDNITDIVLSIIS